MTLQQNFMNVKAQLEKCQEESSLKDMTITQLTETIQKLESELRQLKNSSQEQSDQKKDKHLRQSVKLIAESQSHVGNSYNYSLSFDHRANQNITDKIKADIIFLNPKESVEDILSSCRNYFTNQKKDEQRKINGTFDKHRNNNRKRNAKQKKLEERTLAAYDLRVDLTPEERAKAQYMVGLEKDIISSDESDDECDTDRRKRRKTVDQPKKVKAFYWASDEFVTIRNKLDDGFIEVIAKPQHKRGRVNRIRDSTCPVSDRPAPTKDGCSWMLKLD